MEQIFDEEQANNGAIRERDISASTPGAVILGDQVHVTIVDDPMVNGPTTVEGTGSGGYRFTGASITLSIELLYQNIGPIDLLADGADR